MSYQVTRVFETAEEAIAWLKANDNEPAPKAKPRLVESDDEEPAPKKRQNTAKKVPPPEDDEEPAPKKKPAAKAKPADDEDEDGGLDYERDIRPLVVGLSKDCGREVALEVLEKFENPATEEPCTKGAEVAPEDWPRLLKEIKKARDRHEAE